MSLILTSIPLFSFSNTPDIPEGSLKITSPDQTKIAWVKSVPAALSPDCQALLLSDKSQVDQIWIFDLKTGKENLLVNSNLDCNHMEKAIVAINQLAFSPKGQILYFETNAWVTSGALHAININGSGLKYLTPSNGFKLITTGPDAGDLVINQHRYRYSKTHQLESFDGSWIFTADGKEIRQASPTEAL